MKFGFEVDLFNNKRTLSFLESAMRLGIEGVKLKVPLDFHAQELDEFMKGAEELGLSIFVSPIQYRVARQADLVNGMLAFNPSELYRHLIRVMEIVSAHNRYVFGIGMIDGYWKAIQRRVRPEKIIEVLSGMSELIGADKSALNVRIPDLNAGEWSEIECGIYDIDLQVPGDWAFKTTKPVIISNAFRLGGYNLAVERANYLRQLKSLYGTKSEWAFLYSSVSIPKHQWSQHSRMLVNFYTCEPT